MMWTVLKSICQAIALRHEIKYKLISVVCIAVFCWSYHGMCTSMKASTATKYSESLRVEWLMLSKSLCQKYCTKNLHNSLWINM